MKRVQLLTRIQSIMPQLIFGRIFSVSIRISFGLWATVTFLVARFDHPTKGLKVEMLINDCSIPEV